MTDNSDRTFLPDPEEFVTGQTERGAKIVFTDYHTSELVEIQLDEEIAEQMQMELQYARELIRRDKTDDE